DGDLYKEVWPRPAMSGDVLLEALRTNDDPDDNPEVAAFIEFGNAVGAATEATFVDAMAGFVDIEEVLRYMAVDRAIKNWDGVTAFYWAERSHNFYWYHNDGAQSLFHLIPWDLDQTMWEYDPYMDPVYRHADRQVPDWNVKPLSCSPITVWDSGGDVTVIPAGCDPFINLLAATSWDRFAAIGAELLAGPFDYDTMNERVTAWAVQIASAVDEDPVLNLPGWESQVEYFHDVLQENVEDFRAHLEEGYVVEE
ncbi:MAG: CotH kinase family protein, partial [Polyangiaceae bacterium]|nr:CotH kinase family protein [Polyangiaceae bacterium]